MMAEEWTRGDFSVSTDPSRLDLAVIHAYLTNSYWARNIPLEIVRRAVAGSLPFGVYEGTRQVGFARVVTDRATFAYMADVFALEEYRGKGLGKWLVACIMTHPDLQGLRRWFLATRDAHGLYRQFGFLPLTQPESIMQMLVQDAYGSRE